MNKLAPYFQIPGHGEDVLDNWYPSLPGALFMDIGPDFASHLRDKYVGLKICLRLYEEQAGGWRNIEPEVWAERFIAVRPNYAISWNLPLGQDDSPETFEAFDIWSARFALAVRAHGIEPIGLCVGTGNFTGVADRVKVSDAFPRICETYNILGPHDYGWPTLQSQIYYHALRWTAWYDDIKAAYNKEMLFMPMECGLTQMVLPDRDDLGWQSGADGVTDESYVQTVRWYNEMLCQLDYALWAYVYLFHGLGEWSTFDHILRPHVWHQIRDFKATGPPPEDPEPPPEEPEPPPTGGDTLENIKVYAWDEAGNRHIELTDLAAKETLVKEKYGAAFRRAEVQTNTFVYRLIELWEQSGNSSLKTQVLDEHGNPIPNIGVAFYWPDAPDPPEPETKVTSFDWHRNFIHGPTNVNGDVGPGMGHGAYHGRGEGGPHAVWVREWQIPSDICEKLGMLAGTPHDHLDQKFQLMIAGEEPTPPNGGDMLYRLDHSTEGVHAEGAIYILWPATDEAFDTNARGGIVGGMDLDVSDPVEVGYQGKQYAQSEMSACFEGDEPREFWIQIHRMDAGQTALSKRMTAIFDPKPDPRAIYFIMKLADKPEEPEEPVEEGTIEVDLRITGTIRYR